MRPGLGRVDGYVLGMLGGVVGVFVLEVVHACAGIAFFALGDEVCEFVCVAGGLPDHGVHQDGAVESDDVIPHLDDILPPCFLYVVFELDSEGAVVVAACEAAVDLAGLEYEASSLAERDDIVEFGQLSHTFVSFWTVVSVQP